MPAQPDYYSRLGVKRDASAADIKAAYRRLALEYHPDRAKDKASEERFKQINEAYQVLSDPVKRQQYDQFGHTSGAGAPGGYSNMGGFDRSGFNFSFGGGLGDLFSDLFGQAFSTVQAEVRIAPAQAVLGDRLELTVESERITLTIPPGTQDGAQFVFRGKGQVHGRGRGDLVIIVRVQLPTRISRDQRRLWEELKKLGG